MGYTAGKGTVIYHPELSTFCDGVVFGERCVVHSHCWFGKNVRIGNNVRIQAFTFIPEWVEIEDDVFIGPSVVFTNDRKPPSFGEHWAKILVKREAVIGAGAKILARVVIGEKSTVGMGAVVLHDVPDGETAVGNPARILTRR